MLKNIKKGFGFGIGYCLGKGVINVIGINMLRHVANDDKYMEDLRNRNPDSYEVIKKYKTKKEESVEESEEEEAQ